MAPPQDPLNFVPAEDFFGSLANSQHAEHVVSVVSSESVDPKDPLRYAAHVTLQGSQGNPNTHCLVQFVTPQIWRIRYNPKFADVNQYPDENSRTIVEDSFAGLVDHLQDEFRDSDAWNSYPNSSNKTWFWKTTFEQKAADHWILSSVDYQDQNSQGNPNTHLHFFDTPFRIIATRTLRPMNADQSVLNDLGLPTSAEQIIWQTDSPIFSFQGDRNISVINNVVMNIKKPGPAEYLGFGEQGGRTLLKQPTFMNYFCYDNYNYNKVYGQGALDTKEPLYHSTPFYLEMNNSPGYFNVTGLMVDNYSQVAVDLGKTSSRTIAVGTRFGTFDAYVMAADDVPKMIWQYTSIVGRAKLKPRFVLGHHQGCYGYNSNADVETVVKGYQQSRIPLDGIHLDVDFQDRYRTFTVNGLNWPNVSDFLKSLKAQGIKCCTNITPILTLRDSDNDPYPALRAFWNQKDKLNPATNLLVADQRYLDGLPNNPHCTRYDGGYATPSELDPNNLDQRISYADYIGGPQYRDNYVFIESDPTKPQGNFNSGYPFHGGVSYGPALGTPGYYPDLNRQVARDKWGQQYQGLFDLGLEFVWQDMTTPAAGNCYGDMLGFPSRLLMSNDSYHQDPAKKPDPKTAIELWALYSYNLHKATYHGLNRLSGRQNRRNFIIGRGSQTGMHRFAGLWTGDNASSWDFWRICVAQVLALGYSGLTIAGVDMGGFTKDPASSLPAPWWCDPELLIRWYTGAFLLPWYRNHYAQHFNTKEFQEPWQYTQAPSKYPQIPSELYSLYASVEPICRYYVQLRYTLIQVLYDAMFANLINGLPIARAMLITDPEDTSLFNEGVRFIDNQYLLGHNILVCPVLDPSISSRDVYLPQSDTWYPSNLRINIQGYGPDPLQHAAALGNPVSGGTTVAYYCPIPDAVNQPDQIPYVTPVYIRAGAIIPQLDVRQSINENDLNPPCIHIYPGDKETSYSMYLDDGVSRDSPPANLPQYKNPALRSRSLSSSNEGDSNEAKSRYREVRISQKYQSPSDASSSATSRFITISHPWDGYDASPDIGSTYNLAIWAAKSTAPTDQSIVKFSFQDQDGKSVSGPGLGGSYDVTRGVLLVTVPCALVPSPAGPNVEGAQPSGKDPPKYIVVNVEGLLG